MEVISQVNVPPNPEVFREDKSESFDLIEQVRTNFKINYLEFSDSYLFHLGVKEEKEISQKVRDFSFLISDLLSTWEISNPELRNYFELVKLKNEFWWIVNSSLFDLSETFSEGELGFLERVYSEWKSWVFVIRAAKWEKELPFENTEVRERELRNFFAEFQADAYLLL